MMTPLQALEAIKEALNIEWGNDTCNNDLKPEIDLLTSLITPPTSDEVCEVLSKHLGKPVIYRWNSFFIKLKWHERITVVKNGLYEIITLLPPHLISLIGRFYEAQQ